MSFASLLSFKDKSTFAASRFAMKGRFYVCGFDLLACSIRFFFNFSAYANGTTKCSITYKIWRHARYRPRHFHTILTEYIYIISV